MDPIRFAEGRAMLVAGLRRLHAFTEAGESIPAQWRDLQALVPLPGQQGHTAYGVVCGASHDTGTFEYMSGHEVASFDGLPPQLGRMRVPVQRYAVFEHEGHVSELRATWDAIWSEWLPRSGETPADTPDFERYDERYDPATGQGVIEIWFPVGGGQRPV
jgi:AraC family transcriptional regulator